MPKQTITGMRVGRTDTIKASIWKKNIFYYVDLKVSMNRADGWKQNFWCSWMEPELMARREFSLLELQIGHR